MDTPHQLMTAHHDNLAAWLREGHRTSLDAFLKVHHPDFSLVTTQGEILGLDALGSGLSASGGSRPGLRIAISEMTRLAPDVYRFLERHEVNEDVVDLRVVTAVLHGEQVIALQETARAT